VKKLARFLIMQTGCVAAAFLLLFLMAQAGKYMEASQAGAVKPRIVLFINGTLGDKSFYDSAARGLRHAGSELPVQVRIVEGGTDPTRWQSALTDLADSGDYDMIVTGTYTMVPYVQQLAQEFPDARFVVFDASVDYAKCPCKNVHSMLFRQNEGAYLAGYLAARLDQAGLPGLAPGGGLGVIGGMRIPVIDDFLIGFRAGAVAAAPAVRVQSQYANAFSDPATGKEIAAAQFAAGASLIFHAAGATGQGVNEAAVEARRYAIGVDMDQYALYRTSNPERAAHIVTSVLKNVDVAIFRAVRLHLEDRLPYGSSESLGLAERGVSLAWKSDVLAQATPAILAAVRQVEEAIIAQRLQVPNAASVAAMERSPAGPATSIRTSH
jgi:basic membrane protein A